MIEFFPFNQDLNRLTLVVTGAAAEKKYKVTWGKESKEFTGEALGKGINLAAEFLENPFADAFAKSVDAKVREQQNFETPLVKQNISRSIEAKRAETRAGGEGKFAKVDGWPLSPRTNPAAKSRSQGG